jgi:hypothetical protein
VQAELLVIYGSRKAQNLFGQRGLVGGRNRTVSGGRKHLGRVEGPAVE